VDVRHQVRREAAALSWGLGYRGGGALACRHWHVLLLQPTGRLDTIIYLRVRRWITTRYHACEY
jgi:hypothetical protein